MNVPAGIRTISRGLASVGKFGRGTTIVGNETTTGVGVLVGVEVGVLVAVLVGDGVGILVDVGVNVGVFVGLGVNVGVLVGLGVNVGVFVGNGVLVAEGLTPSADRTRRKPASLPHALDRKAMRIAERHPPAT